MRYLRLHKWKVTPREAARIQSRLRDRLELADRLPPTRLVAGADLAFDLERNRAIAGVIVYGFPEMIEVERAAATSAISFPYVPGLLSFRETPGLLKVFRRLRHAPDLIFYDGHGYAHPRRFGIACHLGVLLDRPVVGCAKSILVGEHKDLAQAAGSTELLCEKGEILGVALRTREGVHPIYVTQGHRVSLSSAIAFVKATLDGYRIPRPTREADHFVAAVKRAAQESVANPPVARRKPAEKAGGKIVAVLL